MTFPTLRIIPSLFLHKGRLVKGTLFKNHIDVGDPVTTSKAFESQGADEIFVIDLDGYRKPQKKNNFKILKKMSQNLMTSITYGGGINSFQKAKDCFRNGADKIYICTELFKNKNLIHEISKVFGKQSIVCGVNVIKKNNNYYIHEKEDISLFDWLKELNKLPIGELKMTLVSSEGLKKGFDIDLCKKVLTLVDHPVVIEGGLGNLSQIKTIAKITISGIAIGTILNFTEQNIIKIKQFLTNQNVKVRK